MGGHSGVGLEELPVDGGQHAHERRGVPRLDDTIVLINHLHELPDLQGHGLDALDLLRTEQGKQAWRVWSV